MDINHEENIFVGWYGGDYEDSGFFDSKKDAERGYMCDNRLHEILSKYKGKKIKIEITILEE